MCPRMKCAEYFLCRANWEMLRHYFRRPIKLQKALLLQRVIVLPVKLVPFNSTPRRFADTHWTLLGHFISSLYLYSICMFACSSTAFQTLPNYLQSKCECKRDWRHRTLNIRSHLEDHTWWIASLVYVSAFLTKHDAWLQLLTEGVGHRRLLQLLYSLRSTRDRERYYDVVVGDCWCWLMAGSGGKRYLWLFQYCPQ